MSRDKKVVSEADVKSKLVKPYLDALGAWHYMPVQMGMGESGIPDHIACVPVTITPDMVGRTFGLFLAIESKRPGRRGEQDRGCTTKQRDNLIAIAQVGGAAIVCDSEEDLQRLTL